jgi:hypothetical protein
MTAGSITTSTFYWLISGAMTVYTLTIAGQGVDLGGTGLCEAILCDSRQKLRHIAAATNWQDSGIFG